MEFSSFFVKEIHVNLTATNNEYQSKVYTTNWGLTQLVKWPTSHGRVGGLHIKLNLKFIYYFFLNIFQNFALFLCSCGGVEN
jgi:hypothetical protein